MLVPQLPHWRAHLEEGSRVRYAGWRRQYLKIGKTKNGNSVFSVKDTHCPSLLIFLLLFIFRVTNFLPKLVDMVLFSTEKTEFLFFFSIFSVLPVTQVVLKIWTIQLPCALDTQWKLFEVLTLTIQPPNDTGIPNPDILFLEKSCSFQQKVKKEGGFYLGEGELKSVPLKFKVWTPSPLRRKNPGSAPARAPAVSCKSHS